ncbi:MAG: phosphohistidine phosphatase SixA [Nevskia sp.]
MKHLALIRHAKSSWDYPLLDDFARPLNPRGRRDVPVMAQRLAHRLRPPWRLVSSPALRAITTAQGFAEALAVPEAEIRLEPRIYEASPGTLLHLVNSLDDADAQVLMFGHNPGFTELAQLLAEVPFAELPTCAVAVLAFEQAHWHEITPRSGRLVEFLYPKGGD